jgi:ribonuclease G
MQNEILINASEGETRVAVLERGQFAELHLERASARSVVSSIVKGRVTRVLPGMQAAFVDIGLEKAGFLYVGDYRGDLGGSGSDSEQTPPAGDLSPEEGRGGGQGGRGRRGRGGNGRTPPSIETLLREGQEIVVQVAKEPIGTKGARITSHLSIPGRHLVLTPWSQRVGVSRRIDADRERRRLREIVERLRPRDLGFIIRTAGEGIREADLEADIRYLTSVWDDVQTGNTQVSATSRLYSEPALPLRVIRDFANSDTRRIVVDSARIFSEMKAFVDRFVADPKPRLEHYEGADPIFDAFGIESQINAGLGRKVWLKSGGYLIIDQSEALTAIDVNTGRYVGKRDLEETVLKTNLEAVKEAVYQLRFRNIGGLIIIDLIDMESAENREKVHRAIQDAVRYDKARTNVLKISELGLVEMTRKRTRENLVQMLCEPCAHCEGRGYTLSRESAAYKVLRQIRKDLPRFCGQRVAVSVNRRVAEYLLGPEREALEGLEAELGRGIEIRARSDLHPEQFEVVALEEGPPVPLNLSWLDPGGSAERGDGGGAQADAAPSPPAEPQESTPSEPLPEAKAPAEQPTPEPAEPEPSLEVAGGSDAPAQPVDSEAEFRILPRSQQSEES